MRYLILGKNIASGIKQNDSADLNVYFELGWELVGSRIDLIREINKNPNFLSSTTIITPQDRMFLYTSFANNVESAESFFLNSTNFLNQGYEIEDWTETRKFRFLNTDEFSFKNDGVYKFFKEDSYKIREGFDLSKVAKEIATIEPYVVISLRFRDHDPYRNSIPKQIINFIKELQSNNIKHIYVFGRGSEGIAKKVGAYYVERLDEFTYLIRQNNCLAFIGQSSGPVLLALMTTPNLICIIDQSDASDLNGNNAVLGGKCIHFGGGEIRKFRSIKRKDKKELLTLIKNLYKEYKQKNNIITIH
jgi:hypothetical protein